MRRMTSLPVIKSFKECVALLPKTVEEVKGLNTSAQETARKVLDELKEKKDAPELVDLRKADIIGSVTSMHSSAIWMAQETHKDKAMRDAAEEASTSLSAFCVDNFTMNRDLYGMLSKYMDSPAFKEAPEKTQYFCREEREGFKRCGLELEGEDFETAAKIQKDLSELSVQFSSNISNDTRSITATREELEGVPEENIKALKVVEEGDDKGKYKVDITPPTVDTMNKNCSVSETRRRVIQEWNDRGYPKNIKVLKDIIMKRQELSKLLNYESFAHRDTAGNMARDPETVRKFLESLAPGLKKKLEKERVILADNLPQGVSLTEEGKFKPWDSKYTENQYAKTNLQVDEESIKEYFPMDTTLKGLFDIYQQFFDLEFKEVAKEELEGLYDDKVSGIEIRQKQGDLVGYVILDLYPRDGKYTHACCNGLIPPFRETEKDPWNPALAVVLANFPEATEDSPALLKHDDVVTFFHEFGHAIHYLSGKSEFPTIGGYNTKTDFVEMPSQLLEEWMWDRDMLKRVSKHYKTGESLPDEAIDKKLAARFFFSGLFYSRQLSFARLALKYHQDCGKEGEDFDTSAVWRAITEDTVPCIEFNPDTHFECSFGHLDGYGAKYYSYLWAEVFAVDCFRAIHEAKGLLDPVWGRKYVDCIIGQGGSKDPSDMVKDFLGRDPSHEQFLKHLGLE